MVSGENITLKADVVFKAIGQLLEDSVFSGSEMPAIEGGKITVNLEFETSLPGFWAAVDCVVFGADLTVQAVVDGYLAAYSITSIL